MGSDLSPFDCYDWLCDDCETDVMSTATNSNKLATIKYMSEHRIIRPIVFIRSHSFFHAFLHRVEEVFVYGEDTDMPVDELKAQAKGAAGMYALQRCCCLIYIFSFRILLLLSHSEDRSLFQSHSLTHSLTLLLKFLLSRCLWFTLLLNWLHLVSLYSPY